MGLVPVLYVCTVSVYSEFGAIEIRGVLE